MTHIIQENEREHNNFGGKDTIRHDLEVDLYLNGDVKTAFVLRMIQPL